MDTVKLIKRLQDVSLKVDAARRILNDGKEIPCDKKLLGVQQVLSQLIRDLYSEVRPETIVAEPQSETVSE